MTTLAQPVRSATPLSFKNSALYHVLRQSREVIEIVHIEDDMRGRRILVEKQNGGRLFVEEAALELCYGAH